MQFVLILALIVVLGIFVWQLVLFIRDIVRKVKSKKNKVASEDKKNIVDETKKGEK